MLSKIGIIIGQVLIVLFLINLAIISFQYYILNSINMAEYFERLILFIIPTEATIAEKLASYPIALIISLYFYTNYVDSV